MSDPWFQPWSNSPTAPHLTKYGYLVEKATLAGSLIGSILYGLLTLLFFQCMVALLNPVHRRDEGINWWLVFYTMAMFSFVTVYTAANLHNLSMSFVDNREPTDPDYSGPLVYQSDFIPYTPLGLLVNIMFDLNNWLADGLLIYRCYIIYSTNLWAIALPCLMYLASFGMGIVTLYFQYNAYLYFILGFSKFGVVYLSISVSLNVLLTLMIVIRLILHARKIRTATGSLAGISRLYKTISTMFIESCALFTVSSTLVIGALAAYLYNWTPNIYIIGSIIFEIFFPILAEIQVIAPLLVIQRVANGSAFTGHAITTGHTSLFNARGQGEPTGRVGTPHGSYPKNSAAGDGNNPGEPGVVERTTDLHPDGEA